MHRKHNLSVRRLARAFAEPASTTGCWLKPKALPTLQLRRWRPVSDELTLRQHVQALADQPRHRTFGYRRIWALLRRNGMPINRKTVRRIMRDLGLSRPKFSYKPKRPRRVEKMRSDRRSRPM